MDSLYRRIAAPFVIVVALLSVPAAATAATASSRIESPTGIVTASYSASPGERNDVTLATLSPYLVGGFSTSSDAFGVTDLGDGVSVATSGCLPLPRGAACSAHVVQDDPEVATRAAGHWDDVIVSLGDEDDRLRIRGLAFGNLITVLGGDGDDVLDLHDRVGQDVRCGPGVDTAFVDEDDMVDGQFGNFEGTSCEQLVVYPCSPLPLGCVVPIGSDPAARL